MTTSSFFRLSRAGIRWLPAICFAIAIFFFSSIPGDEIGQSYGRFETTIQSISPTSIPQASTARKKAMPPFKIDWLKVGHGIGYFCLGLSVHYALFPHSHRASSIALLICCLYSTTDEFHQMFTPGRSASPWDVLLDTLAAFVGIVIMQRVIIFFNRKKSF
jgi:VanZ family protein